MIFYILIENQQIDSTTRGLKSIFTITYKVLEVSVFTVPYSICMKADALRVWPGNLHVTSFPHDSCSLANKGSINNQSKEGFSKLK